MFAFLRKLRLRRRLEREMAEELAFHADARATDLERLGLAPAEAVRRAAIEFGGVERYKEQLRAQRRFTWFEDFVRDSAYAFRNLRRSPGFVLSVAGAIALGIGLNTTLFSVAYGVLFRPLPIADPGSVRDVYLSLQNAAARSAYESRFFFSWEELRYVRAHAQTADVAGFSGANVNASFAASPVRAELVSSNLLSLCGARPAQGRLFTPDDDASAGSGAVVVISYDAWQRYFHGEDVAGRQVVLNRTPFTIVGVANDGFYGPEILKPDLWFPLSMEPITRSGEPLITNPNAGFIQVLARLREGEKESATRAELQLLAQQTVADHAGATATATVILSPAAFLNFPDLVEQSVPVLAILFGMVSLVLLAACANVAGMLVARGFGRAREIGVRLSLGAGKARIVRQLLTEHLLLGLLGGATGLALSQVVLRLVAALVPGLPGHQLALSPDWRVVGWTVLLALVAGILFGVPSAFGAVRGDLTKAVRGDALDVGGRGRRFRVQTVLTAVQVAVSAMLLVSASLLVRAASHALHIDPGFASSGVVALRPGLREAQYTPVQAERFVREFRDRAAALPGIVSVSWTGFQPVVSSCGTEASTFDATGQGSPSHRVACNEIGTEYFNAMRIRLLAGRAFTASDEQPAAHSAIVDESFARRYLTGSPLGQRIHMPDDREIVGVVASTRNLMPMSDDSGEVYTPLAGLRYLEAWVVVRYDGPQGPVVKALQSLSNDLDRDVPVSVRTIEENVATALAPVRIAAAAVAGLGLLALALACAGVYGVVAFTVARRRREIGIRMALGAEPRGVLRLLLWQSLRPAMIGAAMGAAMAVAAGHLIRAFLYGVSPEDPAGVGAALALLAAIAATAALVPASAALRVDPAVTLRHD